MFAHPKTLEFSDSALRGAIKRVFDFFGIALLLLTFPSVTFAASLKDQAKNAEETAGGISGLFDTLIEKSPSWVVAFLVFVGSFALANIVKSKVVDKFSEKFAAEDQDVLVLVGRSSYALTLALGITVALKIGGIDITAIVAAVGFGLGFAMQDLMTNFIAGILILLNRPFTIGDFIKVGETVGKVMEIQSRATILKAIDGTRVIVPNADLFTNQVTSFTSNPFRRVEIIMSASYGSDVNYVQKVIRETLKQTSKILLEPKPTILLHEFGDSSIDFAVRFWVDSRSNWMKTKSEVMGHLLKNFDAAGIDVPFNTLNLVLDRENEKVVQPIYSVSREEMDQKIKTREAKEAALAQQIASDESAENSAHAEDADDSMDALLPGSPPIPAVAVNPADAVTSTAMPATTLPSNNGVVSSPALGSVSTAALPVVSNLEIAQTVPPVSPIPASSNGSSEVPVAAPVASPEKVSSIPGMPGAVYVPPSPGA